MAVLTPYPFGLLVDRMVRELDRKAAIFDLPARKFFLGDPARDLTVHHHGRPAASPLAPAAGPHTQMAQNIVLSWLGGCRLFELKTVQVRDDLEIPRPCIDMATVGYNVEWSQELTVAESLEEYVKASMLIRILEASGRLALAPNFRDHVFDMSVGYDLAGIRSDKVQGFLRGMRDAGPVIDRLRAEIPAPYAAYRDLDFNPHLSDTLTLSTFHGCPPDEIERIVLFLLEDFGLHCTVKLNPTLLGKPDCLALLHDTLGYGDLTVPDQAFADDTRWDQAVAFSERLRARAAALGLGYGVKFTNTLIVENHRPFFPSSETVMYLSGPPLHVLAMELVKRWRGVFGDGLPISFSAGIDRRNFADAVALGLVPVSVCTDLLKAGGYGRAEALLRDLCQRMAAVGAGTIADYTRAMAGSGAADLSAARLANTDRHAAAIRSDPSYRAAANAKPPRKVDSTLVLFDCLTCDKCLPVCPNDANFTFRVPVRDIPVQHVRRTADGWTVETGDPLRLEKPHQIGNFADFCNDCGNCDVFCPELGGPYILKPRFFGSYAAWAAPGAGDGFHVTAGAVHGRIGGRLYHADVADPKRVGFRGDGFALHFDPADIPGSLGGTAESEVDLTPFHILRALHIGLLADDAVNPVESLVRAGDANAAVT